MTEDQATNVLDWVEALLSGKYTHCSVVLHNPGLNHYSAVGVAARLGGFNPHPDTGLFWFGDKYGGLESRHRVPDTWFAARFGLRYDQNMYITMNDRGESYLAVVALLLNSVPLNKRVARLQNQFQEVCSVTAIR